MPSFHYVFIPSSAASDVEERTMEYDSENQVSCLIDTLKVHFKAVVSGDPETRKAVKEVFKKRIGQDIPDSSLDEFLNMQMVDTVALLSGGRHSNFVHINMYVDDQGTAKGLPHNQRASSLAEACGCPVKVLGDAFVARVQDSDDDFARMDFRLSELSSDSKWITVARDLNRYRHQGEGANRLSEMIKSGEITSGAAPNHSSARFPEHASWVEHGSELEFRVHLPDGVTKAVAKQKLRVKALPYSLSVTLDVPGSPNPLFEATQTTSRLDNDGLSWHFDGDHHIVITTEKAETIFVGLSLVKDPPAGRLIVHGEDCTNFNDRAGGEEEEGGKQE